MIFPWSGRGIFILGYAVLGALGGLVSGHFLTARLHISEEVLSIALAKIGLAVGAWLFAMTLGKTEVYATVDPDSQRPMIRRHRHTLLLVPAWLWAMLASIFIAAPAATPLIAEMKTPGSAGNAPESAFNLQSLQALYARVLQTLDQKLGRAPAAADAGSAPSSSGDPKVIEIGPGGPISKAPQAPPPPQLPTPVRDWKDTSGRTMEARLERFASPSFDVAEFTRTDGRVFQLPLTRFCAEDQDFINSLAAQARASSPPSALGDSGFTLPTPLREWTDSTGRVMTASLERFTTPDGGVAEFKRDDGYRFRLPVARFCAEDQATLVRLAAMASLPPSN